jgi:serine/threonine protein kinase
VDVALKFMKNKDQFCREVESRRVGQFDEGFVIGLMHSHDSDSDGVFKSELAKYGLSEYPYCIVMKAGSRNLYEIIGAEKVAKNMEKVRYMVLTLARGLQHMHSNGQIHGDFKPKNVMRLDDRLVLIDLDATAAIDSGYSGAKFSSAYMPPELVYMDEEGGTRVKTFHVNAVSGEPIADHERPYELVKASAAHDAWSLGATLLYLCAGEPLFLHDSDDNLDPEHLLLLSTCPTEWMQKKLSKIDDSLARNLVSQLLSFDPKRRPSMSQVLAHPFISGASAGRLVGQEPEFDLFISYRVASDSAHAERLYDSLTVAGLRVWWDKKCLLPGVPW